MADVTLTYKGQNILELSASGSKTLLTKEKYCEDDISMVYNRPILSGTSEPSNEIGNDGDIYIRSFPIPDNVNFVESLSCSTDGAYINTGVYATPLVDADVYGNRGSGKGTLGCMLGVRTGAFNNMKNAIYFGSHDMEIGGVTAYKAGTSATLSPPNVINHTGAVRRKIRTIKNGDESYTYIGVFEGNASVYGFTQSGNWISDMPLCMYRFYNGTTLSDAAPTTIYRVTIYNNGVPVRDYLPAIDSNNVPCMWDSIAGEYVYNSNSSGTFTAGNILQEKPDPLQNVFYQKKHGVWINLNHIN